MKKEEGRTMKRKEFLKSIAGTVAGAAMLPGLRLGAATTTGGMMLPPIDPSDESFWKLLRDEFPLTHERGRMRN